MLNNKRISVCAPMLNEEFFLPFWLKCVEEIADEVIITDGGSTDNSVKLVEEWWGKLSRKIDLSLEVKVQEGRPFFDWKEYSVRSAQLEKCTGDIVCVLDVDEIIEKKDFEHIIGSVSLGYTMINPLRLSFWGDLHTIRMSVPNDMRWRPVFVPKIFVRGSWQYTTKVGHHTPLVPALEGVKDRNLTLATVFHLHYGFGAKGIKAYDNRLLDVLTEPLVNDAVIEGAKLSFTLDYSSRFKTQISLCKYFGPWPKLLEDYL